ncbi:hypothetical protein COOONC_15613 [Cooperia oncophora]
MYTLIEYYVRGQEPVTTQSGAMLITPVKKQKWELRHEWINLDKLLGEGAFGGVYAGVMTYEGSVHKVTW